MEKDELGFCIDSVFDKERNDWSRGKLPWITEEKEEGVKIINYPHSDTLVDIFSNIQNNKDLKEEFFNILQKHIQRDEEEVIKIELPLPPFNNVYRYVTVLPLCFYTLVRLGFVKESIKSIDSKPYTLEVGSQTHGLNGFIKFLYELFQSEENYFSLIDLSYINIILEHSEVRREIEKTKKELQTFIINEKYNIIKKRIKSVNLEINQDRKVVSEKIKYLDFDPKYNKFLIEVDKFINTDTSGIVNSGMISNLRSFMENLIRDMVKKISSEDSEEIPKIKGLGDMGNIRNYLKTKLGLSDNDHKFINSFIDILHKEGGHTFTSEKEYFRLTRNICIEITLLILSKYEKRLKK